MLQTLRIRDLAIIEELTIEFGPGLNLLTGETGAGKSILVDALGLAAGQRTDRSLVRSHAERAVVEAVFELGTARALLDWMRERGLGEIEEGQLVVRREISREGPGRVFLNGSPAPLNLLRELGEGLLELHGQHEHQSLLLGERQLELLDRFGEHAALAARVERTHERVRSAMQSLSGLRSRAGDRKERLEELGRRVREIDAVRPRPGELDELDCQRRILRNAGRMAELLDQTVTSIYEGEPAAAALAASAARRAEELASLDPALGELAERIRAASVELEDAGTALRDYRERSDFDPRRLEALEARQAAIEQLARRYGADEAGLLRLCEEARTQQDMLGDLEGLLHDAESEVGLAERDYLDAAAALTAARRGAAARLVPALEAQFAALALGQARFDVAFHAARGSELQSAAGGPVPLAARGAERVEFLLAANPGEPKAPLNQVASGGELSRVMLALHVVAGGAGERALVFDEVDAGIGGAVADAVGARLASLARRQQVLCVTHLPQVAAHADRHYRVAKTVSAGRTRAEIARLEGQARVEELARMMGGRRATPASRQHATELLAAAGRAADPAAQGRRV